jgi:oligopeptide/dipeptide ABC transporter ATP-binding protein
MSVVSAAVSALAVEDLSVELPRDGTTIRPVNGVSFAVERGGSLAIVGESGSGKSVTLRAILGLLPKGGRITSGHVAVEGRTLKESRRNLGRGRDAHLSIVFQDPLAALNPVLTVGAQIAEAPRFVLGLTRRAARDRALELLRLVGIPDPVRRYDAYPHELSGGLRQRVMIAVALSSEPKVLLCDEPTTSLDVTIQAQVLALLSDLRRDEGLALVFVTHDLGVAAEVAEDLAVMYAGRLVETGPVSEVLSSPKHPYTFGLLESAIDVDTPDRIPLAIPGSLPDLSQLPKGCAFHPRCFLATPECTTTDVELRSVGEGRASACLHADQLTIGTRRS